MNDEEAQQFAERAVHNGPVLDPMMVGFGMTAGVTEDGVSRRPLLYFVSHGGAGVSYLLCAHSLRTIIDSINECINDGQFSFDDCKDHE